MEFSDPKKETPALLLFYEHASHNKNLEVIDVALDNGVISLCFPPHRSNRLESLDMAFMKHLKQYYEQHYLGYPLLCFAHENYGKSFR